MHLTDGMDPDGHQGAREMARFTTENTEGYTAADLAILNELFDAETGDAVAEAAEALGEGNSYFDHIAERILADFDSTRP